ncbi:MAG TPA: hypothetical protein VN958_00655, partial [Chitinophagaceae bacterium]|nr:hypothetical protein [Chitinophagaceae bacterium]
DFFYLFYQYQRRNIVYCVAAKLDGNGKIIGSPKELDTTTINFFANNKLYTIINSDDKQKIMVFKVNSKNPDINILTTSLFDANLNLINKTRIGIPLDSRNEFLTEFTLDNDGELVFAKPSGTSQNDNISEVKLITKEANSDTISFYDLTIPKIYLDDIRIKVDNINKRYLITSFYSKTKRGNIDGLYGILWDKVNAGEINTSNTMFSEEMRTDAKSEGSVKSAFNDFFIQNILVRKDGGFAIASESAYSSSRGIYNNRWDYYSGSPFLSPYNYYNYWNTPLYSSYYYPWWRWGGTPAQINRYFADNIAIMSFDSTGNLQWTNIIHKSQYDDYTDNFIGYGTLNSGEQIHFLFNQSEKRALLLTDQTLTPDGQINRSPTLHNLDKDFQFMPRYGRQVSSHELIVPCQYRNFICFARIEF